MSFFNGVETGMEGWPGIESSGFLLIGWMALWVCPDSVDTFTMPQGQGFPDLFFGHS